MSLDDTIAETVRTAIVDGLADAMRGHAPERPLVYTIAQCADALQLSQSTVRRKIAAGIIPTLDLGDVRLVRIPVAALDHLPIRPPPMP